MACGMKNKVRMLSYKITHALICCVVLIMVHDGVHYFYMQHYRVISHGVTLGFVSFYILYVMCPSIFVMSFLRGWWFTAVFIIATTLLFYFWFSSNPLRVLLMVSSYVVATICLVFLKRINKHH